MKPGDGSGRLPAPSVAAASASGDELARTAALAEYGILDTEPEDAFDALAFLAAHICGTPMAAVSFLDSDRQWFKAEVGLGVHQTAREVSFCQHAIAAPAEVLVVPDARTDARFAANPLVSGSPGLRFYAGAPMVTPAGAALGSVCVLDSTPRELTADQRAALQALSRQAVALLEARRTLGELALASRERERQQERLRLTGADALTGLGSRSWFTTELAQELATGAVLSVLVVDLDRFRAVNDSLGPAVGDRLLRHAGARLAAGLRPQDRLARIGGDEFAVLLPDTGRPTAVGVAARLRQSVSQPAELASVRLVSDACVGVATAPARAATGTGRSVEAAALELLRNATLALDAAKAAGAGQVQTYRRALHTRARRQLSLYAALPSAVADGRLQVHYPPIVSLDTARPYAAEALARWTHPELGPASPVEFIPLAEETGLIVEIGAWVLRQACAAAVGWPSPRRGDRAPAVSVNVSGRQLMADSIVGTVAGALRETGLAPARLTVEITESALVEDDAAISGRLGDLRGLGVHLAIDDFGTGYSSLGRLAHLPLDVLKIDKSFVDDLTTNPRSSALVAAVIALANSLGLATVAEGIETAPQRLALARLGCRAGQGYLFGRPVPAAQAGRLWEPALHAVGRQQAG